MYKHIYFSVCLQKTGDQSKCLAIEDQLNELHFIHAINCFLLKNRKITVCTTAGNELQCISLKRSRRMCIKCLSVAPLFTFLCFVLCLLEDQAGEHISDLPDPLHLIGFGQPAFSAI